MCTVISHSLCYLSSPGNFWTQAPDMPYATSGEAAGWAYNTIQQKTYIIAAGGFDNTRVQIFDPELNTWRYGPEMPLDIRYGAVIQFNNTFMIVGGDCVSQSRAMTEIYQYEPDTETWLLRPESLSVRREHTAAFLVPNSYAKCT